MKENKYYNIALILYPSAKDYNCTEVLTYISNHYEKYAYILHSAEEEEKKEHYHVVIKFPNKRYISAVARELHIEPNYIQKCNLKSYLRYLIHFDDEDKVQYDIEDVKGTLVPLLKKYLQNEDTTKVSLYDIINYIDNCLKKISYRDLLDYVLSNEYISVYLRYYRIIQDIINEHNNFIDKYNLI